MQRGVEQSVGKFMAETTVAAAVSSVHLIAFRLFEACVTVSIVNGFR
jgi:hypothetical protein